MLPGHVPSPALPAEGLLFLHFSLPAPSSLCMMTPSPLRSYRHLEAEKESSQGDSLPSSCPTAQSAI